MAKDKKCPECPPEGAPAWMATYGDLMTLLLTFFVLLLSFSSMQEAEFYRAIGALQGALGVLSDEQSAIVSLNIPMPQMTNLKESEVMEALAELQEITTDMELSESIKLDVMKTGMRITITDSLAFPSGSSHLKLTIFPLLLEIASLVRDWPNTIRVIGHTDNRPIDTEEFPDNWALSTARATSVVRYFADVEGGQLDPSRLMSIGKAEGDPKFSNETAAGRSKNRRVEIYIDFEPERAIPSQFDLEQVKEKVSR